MLANTYHTQINRCGIRKAESRGIKPPPPLASTRLAPEPEGKK